METIRLLQRSQEPNGPYLEPDAFSPQFPTLFP